MLRYLKVFICARIGQTSFLGTVLTVNDSNDTRNGMASASGFASTLLHANSRSLGKALDNVSILKERELSLCIDSRFCNFWSRLILHLFEKRAEFVSGSVRKQSLSSCERAILLNLESLATFRLHFSGNYIDATLQRKNQCKFQTWFFIDGLHWSWNTGDRSN